MSIASDVRTFIIADATITGLIAARLYPIILPQEPTMPAMTYQWISGTRFHSMDGASKLSGPRVQFDCWAATYLDAEALFEALRKRLDGYRGPAGSSTIQGAFFSSERDLYESEPKLYRRSVDFFIFHTEG